MKRKTKTRFSADNEDALIRAIAAKRSRTDFKPVQGILESLLKRHGLDKRLQEYEFVSRWSEVVGDSVAKVSKPECIRRNSLVVRVSSSAWAQELSFHKREMLANLKKIMPGDSRVNDISFYVGDLGC